MALFFYPLFKFLRAKNVLDIVFALCHELEENL